MSVQGRLAWLQKGTAHSSTVAPAVVVGVNLPYSDPMQGRSVLLQGATARSSTVASAVVSRSEGVQGKLIFDLPCSSDFRLL